MNECVFARARHHIHAIATINKEQPWQLFERLPRNPEGGRNRVENQKKKKEEEEEEEEEEEDTKKSYRSGYLD